MREQHLLRILYFRSRHGVEPAVARGAALDGVGQGIVHRLKLLDDGIVHVDYGLRAGNGCLNRALGLLDGRSRRIDGRGRVGGRLRQRQVALAQAGHRHGREVHDARLHGIGQVGYLLQLIFDGFRVGARLGQLALRRGCLVLGLRRRARKLAHRRARIGDGVLRAAQLVCRVGGRTGKIALGIGNLVVERVGHHGADRRDELAVDRLVKGGRSGVGHLRRNGIDLLVHVILDVRLLEIARQYGEQVRREVAGDDEGRIGAPRLHFLHGFVVAHEIPLELRVLMQGIDNLVAEVHTAHQLVVAAGVLVHHADAHVARVVVRVPKADDVEPGVRRGQHDQDDDDDQGGRGLRQAKQIAPKHAQSIQHD